MSHQIRRAVVANWLILLALIISFTGCSKPEKPAFKVFASA